MNFSFSSEQVMLRNSLGALLRDRYSFPDRCMASQSREGWRREIWSALANDLGLFSLALPREKGGLGEKGGPSGGAVEHMIVMEEFGHTLVIEPYLETIVIGAQLLAQSPGDRAAHALAQIIDGSSIIAFAWAEPAMRYRAIDVATTAMRGGSGWILNGKKSVVVGAPWADHLIVVARSGGSPGEVDGLSLFLIDKNSQGITEHAYPTIDGRLASDLTFDKVSLPQDALLGAEDGALPVIEEILDRAIAATSAEAVGAMRRMLRDTIDYTGQRRQFGQSLSQFQALQHRMVDMSMQIEMALSATYLVTLKLDRPAAERARAASSAKVTIGKAARFVGQNAVQLHGGMGMTDELPIGHYFKRTTMIEGEFGDADYHMMRYAMLSRLGS